MNSLKSDILIFIGAFILFCIMMSLNGCSSVKPVVVTKEVMVPVKCEAEIPERPSKVNSVIRNVASIVEYTEKLEVIIDTCVVDKKNRQ